MISVEVEDLAHGRRRGRGAELGRGVRRGRRSAAKAAKAAKRGEAGAGRRREPAKRWRAPAGRAGEGGEAGEAGAASAYAGLSGDQLTALRIQHLRGLRDGGGERVNAEAIKPAEAAVLVQQGCSKSTMWRRISSARSTSSIIRSAADGDLNRAQMMQRFRAAKAEIDARARRAARSTTRVLTVRMVDIATGLYQRVRAGRFRRSDRVSAQHGRGARGARVAHSGRDELRSANTAAYQRSAGRTQPLRRAVAASERARTAARRTEQVLAQGSRVRLALSPFL